MLDLCTGGGSLAILAARVFPNAAVDAADISADALAVARRNVEEHGLEERIRLVEGDLFSGLGASRYDLILANPPYVESAAAAAFPPEYAAEPKLAHVGGKDGLDVVRRIVAAARGHLRRGGGLICEIGQGRAAFEASFPDLEVVWLDTSESEGEVFFAVAEALPKADASRSKIMRPKAAAPPRPERSPPTTPTLSERSRIGILSRASAAACATGDAPADSRPTISTSPG